MKTNGKTEIELTCQFENNVLLFCHLDNIMRNNINRCYRTWACYYKEALGTLGTMHTPLKHPWVLCIIVIFTVLMQHYIVY